MSIDALMNKDVIHIYNGIFLSHKDNETGPPAETWMDPERVTQGEVRRKEKNKYCILTHSFPGGLDSKEFACSAGDPGIIPGSGRSPRKGKDSSTLTWRILVWRIPWTEEPGVLQSMGSQRVGHE